MTTEAGLGEGKRQGAVPKKDDYYIAWMVIERGANSRVTMLVDYKDRGIQEIQYDYLSEEEVAFFTRGMLRRIEDGRGGSLTIEFP